MSFFEGVKEGGGGVFEQVMAGFDSFGFPTEKAGCATSASIVTR